MIRVTDQQIQKPYVRALRGAHRTEEMICQIMIQSKC